MAVCNPNRSEAMCSQELQSVADFMRDPAVYRDDTTHVDTIETHISWIYLTDRFAYKLKKPVRFEFLDFSTVDRRRNACQDELLLNRRLAPGVYLDVLPIARDSRGRLELGGGQEPVDWVVKMRRLPADRSLDRLIREQRVTTRDVTALSDVLIQFYSQLPPLTVRAEEYWRHIAQHVGANSAEIGRPQYGLDSWLLQRLHGAQVRFLSLGREILDDRVRDGRIVDGHGDLRPEHVYFVAAPKIIDCLEFNAELRAIDVVDELAFLAMECDALNAPWIGDQILERYFNASNDRPRRELVEFFRCYRACVRAKVMLLRSDQLNTQESARPLQLAREYLALADRSAARLGPQLLLVVRGLSGTGKSTLAAALADALGCTTLSTDQLRQQLFAPTGIAPGYNTGRYEPENRQRVYTELLRKAAECLDHGLSVVLDGTFLRRDMRQAAIDLAARHQAIALIVNCTCTREAAADRIRDRMNDPATDSEIRPEFLARQSEEEEPSDPSWQVCTVDTSDGLPVSQQRVLERIRQLLFA